MHFQAASILLGAITMATAASAQAVVGKAYGFATGVTGGGSAAAVVPSSADELAKLLSDDTPRTIVINKAWDFTGTKATGAGCDRKSCSSKNGGQLYLGTLSCGGSDNVAVSSITYDKAGNEPLIVGSNKSIIGSGGKGVLNGKGLRIKKGAKNVIIQGFEVTNLNPGIVWGGDAIDLQGNNDGVWIDHMKISKIGRMFIVTHYDGSRLTVSNNEFDGQTTTSASCNNNHYWTMMFYGKGDQVTLDRNYFHDVSGRAPKLGEPGVTGTFQASNNYFKNMKGHAFDVYPGASALLEGNVFESVSQPITKQGASVNTVFNVKDAAAASACSSSIGRACQVNSLTSSGDWPSLVNTGALSALSKAKNYLVKPVAASQVASLVSGSAGPTKLGSSGAAQPAPAPAPAPVKEEASKPTATVPAPAPAPAKPTTAPSTGAVAAAWAQCGGQGYTGATKCVSGTTCVKQNDWYSQCLSNGARRKARSVRRQQMRV